ncbi:unnamed protein product, partial [marine sediment metagenome]
TGKIWQGNGAGRPVPVDPPAAGAVLVVARTQVFMGFSPSAWTDLDLSGTIGENAALVLLKVWLSSYTDIFAVRKDGDTYEYYSETQWPHGCALARAESGHIVVLVPASDSGIIEWRCQNERSHCSVHIIAYIK